MSFAAATSSSLTLSSVATRPHLRLMAAGAARCSFTTCRPLPASHPKASASESYIKGTVNEATTYPPPSPVHGHQHWAFERVLSVALLPLTALAVAKHGSSGVLDAALGLSLVAHSHIGFDAIFTDYMHKRKFPIAGRIWPWAVRGASLAAIAGLYEMQTNDVGLTELIAKVWTA
ncbi:unnamed protein product [Parajaminaea phylloscopi]